MILPYLLRLLCLCLAAFFLVHTGLGLATILISPAALRISERMRPRTAARFLFALRLLPSTLAAFLVVGLCVPSYLRFEPRFETQGTAEQVSFLCLAAALMGATICLISLTRAARGVAGSIRLGRRFDGAAQESHVAGEPSSILVISAEHEGKVPLLVLAGVIHPRVVISESVMHRLSTEQLDVALRHERAHRTVHDNFKRLLLLLSPDALPFWHSFAVLEKNWVRLTEWAADDEAVAGDPGRALTLATAIIGLARMGAGPRLAPLLTALVAEDHDLAARVDRLLASAVTPEPSPKRALWGSGALLIAGCMATLVLGTPFSAVHQLLERLIR